MTTDRTRLQTALINVDRPDWPHRNTAYNITQAADQQFADRQWSFYLNTAKQQETWVKSLNWPCILEQDHCAEHVAQATRRRERRLSRQQSLWCLTEEHSALPHTDTRQSVKCWNKNWHTLYNSHRIPTFKWPAKRTHVLAQYTVPETHSLCPTCQVPNTHIYGSSTGYLFQ